MKRRTEIIVETERVILIRRRRRERKRVLWCEACGAESLMLTMEEAAALLGVTSRQVLRWAEAGSLHWTEPEAGALLICRTSLLAQGR
ncbi:MAG TPA: hypothetical protein VF544_18745 [Pyrinomonadaceae bacterium]|jgi:excisionase family DNA binding protein